MNEFNIIAEIYGAMARYRQQHGKVPTTVSVSGSIYSAIMAVQKEALVVDGADISTLVSLPFEGTEIPVVIDERICGNPSYDHSLTDKPEFVLVSA